MSETPMPSRVGVIVALLIGLLGGWVWGASGRAHQDRALQAADLCNDLLEARTSLLAARVDLDDTDSGGMSRHLAAARSSPTEPECDSRISAGGMSRND